MIWSVLPLGAVLSAAAVSRISCSRSLADSPACQRLLHRVIDAGIGLFARHVPLANWKKSSHGCTLRSRSVTSMPCREEFWAEQTEAETSNNASRDALRNLVMNLSGTDLIFADSYCRS